MAKRVTKKAAGKKVAKKTTKKVAKKPAAKKVAKKTTKKVAKKTTTRAAAAPKAPRIVGAKQKARTKSEVLATIAEHTGISKKEVASVFEVMGDLIAADLKKGNIGVFNVPGMMKVTVQRKPATKARKGINPFTKEPTTFAAKPARNVVKVRPLKALKDRV